MVPGTNKELDQIQWNAFKKATPFGILRWTFSEPADNDHFLDLLLNINDNKIITQIYKKEQNFYNYLSPHLCHSPGITYGSIYGGIKQIFELTSLPDIITRDIKKFFNHWL